MNPVRKIFKLDTRLEFMFETDHDLALYEIHKYMLSEPEVFEILQQPSYGTRRGEDLIARNKCLNVLEYVEVELDATESEKATRMAEKAVGLFHEYKIPIRMWMVSGSNKWVKMIREKLRELEKEGKNTAKIHIDRISLINIGRGNFPF